MSKFLTLPNGNIYRSALIQGIEYQESDWLGIGNISPHRVILLLQVNYKVSLPFPSKEEAIAARDELIQQWTRQERNIP